MPVSAQCRVSFRLTRLAALLAGVAMQCSIALLAAAQVEPSATARTIAALNQAIAGGTTARIAGARAAAPSPIDATVLQGRAALMRELMQTHPEEVRSVMLPAALTGRLLAADPEGAQYLEHEASATANLATITADDFASGAAQQIYVLHDTATAEQFLVHPATALALGATLHRPVTVSGVQLGADLLLETVTPLTTTSVQADLQHSRAVQAAAVPASNTTLTCSSTGEQRTAVLLLQFPNNTPAFPGSYGTAAWWKQAITGSGNSVNSLWSEMTAGGTYATADVYGPLTLSRTYGCQDYSALRTAALTLASNTVDLSQYTRVVLGFAESNCSYGGLADIGCNGADKIVPHPYSVVWMPILTSYTASTGVWGSLAHELGHNLGLNHADTLDFGSTALGPIDFQATNPGTVGGNGSATARGAVTAVDTEYGDISSAMGNPWTAGPGPYSAEHRAKLLGWVPASGDSNGLGSTATAGTYTLRPASGGSGLRALRVLRDAASASWLWLEYRDGSTALDAANLRAIKGSNASEGAVVHYENGYGDHEKTFALDMTPTAKGNNFADGALLPGRTWSDPYSPLSLTVSSLASTGLNVAVQYDATCATFTLPTGPVSMTGGSGRVAVSAPPTCSWTASSNATWLTLAGTTSGTGDGAFTWTAAANESTGQRTTYLTAGRVSQRLLQLGSGANVVALSPTNATVAAASSHVLSLTLEDASGVADLQSVTLEARVAGSQTCSVMASFSSSGAPVFYLLDGSLDTYTRGVGTGSAGAATTAACTLSGAGSGVLVNGSTMTLTVNLTFPAALPGMRALYATVNGGAELPVGLLNVGSATMLPTDSGTQTSQQKATTTTLTSAPASALPGATVALNAAVTGTSAADVPTGTVTFLDGSGALSSVALDASGRASLATRALAVGDHTLTAVYGGDGSFAASTSAAVTVSIVRAATTTSLRSSATSVSVGSSAVLTVGVGYGSGMAAPTGTVTLRDGGTAIASAMVSDAGASFPLSALAQGTHVYTAVYSGDVMYKSSASESVMVTAGKPSAKLVITAPGTVLAGAAVDVSVTASALAGTGGAPTGTVLLQEGSRSVGTLALRNGTGGLLLTGMTPGTHTITATYAGDSSYAAAMPVTTTVDIVDFTLAGPGTQADVVVKAGAQTGNTAGIALTPGSSGFPLSVTFACNGAPVGATCTVTPGSVRPGGASVPLTVTVTTTAASGAKVVRAAAWFGMPLLAILATPRPRRVVWPRLPMLVLACAAGMSLAGCGSGLAGDAVGSGTILPTTPTTPTATPSGRSVLVVQGSAVSDGATLTRTAVVTLQVN